MQTVNREEAAELVGRIENLIVVFTKDNCPVCKKLLPEVLDVLEPEMPFIKMVKVDATNDKMLFGPDLFPSTYVFRQGQRIDWIRGAGPLEPVKAKLHELFSKPMIEIVTPEPAQKPPDHEEQERV